jgi:ssDNA-binding replication factor A large subunit
MTAWRYLGERKQGILVCDDSGKVRLTVWEKDVDTVKENCSYRLSGMMVREYQGKKYLSISKDSC